MSAARNVQPEATRRDASDERNRLVAWTSDSSPSILPIASLPSDGPSLITQNKARTVSGVMRPAISGRSITAA